MINRKRMKASAVVLGIAALAVWCWPHATSQPLLAQDKSPDKEAAFEKTVRPILRDHCNTCHSTEKQKAGLDLERFTSVASIKKQTQLWEHALEQLATGEMPPKKAKQMTAEQQKQLTKWIRETLDEVALANAGDPGAVTLRRLNNAEYDNVIRDLTGADMRPTKAREFPADSVGGEGFANVGDAMPVTPGLVERYHQTARDVAARVVLLPKGFRFSPSPDRPTWAEEALKSLRKFHARHAGSNGEPPLAAHLAATLKHRQKLTSASPEIGRAHV